MKSLIFGLGMVFSVAQAAEEKGRAPELPEIAFEQIKTSAENTPSSPGAPDESSGPRQLLLVDFLGQKGGVLEMLYSDSGRKELASRINAAMKAEGDSVYFIFEVPDFSEAILVSYYVKENGSLVGKAVYAQRSRNAATAACDEKTMRAADLGYRADTCYYRKYSTIGYPSFVPTSAPDFVSEVKDFSEEYAPRTPIFTFLKQHPGLNAEALKLSTAFRTRKLKHFLGLTVLNEVGWEKDLSTPSGWTQGQVSLSADQVKMLAGIRRLVTDNKTYLSRNVECKEKSDNNVVMDNASVSADCEPRFMMNEYLDDFFEAMEKAGYRYEETSRQWRK